MKIALIKGNYFKKFGKVWTLTKPVNDVTDEEFKLLEADIAKGILKVFEEKAKVEPVAPVVTPVVDPVAPVKAEAKKVEAAKVEPVKAEKVAEKK